MQGIAEIPRRIGTDKQKTGTDTGSTIVVFDVNIKNNTHLLQNIAASFLFFARL